jgi:hypothetical protein
MLTFSLTPVGWYITSTHHVAQPLPRSSTRRSFIAFVIVCDTNDRTCGQRQLRSSITIMHLSILRIWFRRSWPNTAFPWFVRLPTPLTWLRAIFGYSPSLKCRWKGPDLNQEKTLCGTRQPSWTFQKMRSRSVSNNGGTARISVCITKGTTLKEIGVNLFYVYFCLKTVLRSKYVAAIFVSLPIFRNCSSLAPQYGLPHDNRKQVSFFTIFKLPIPLLTTTQYN